MKESEPPKRRKLSAQQAKLLDAHFSGGLFGKGYDWGPYTKYDSQSLTKLVEKEYDSGKARQFLKAVGGTSGRSKEQVVKNVVREALKLRI